MCPCSIETALDSHSSLEVEAALDAADEFCIHSPAFCAAVGEHLRPHVEGVS